MKNNNHDQNEMNAKQLAINMVFSVVAFVLNFGISFFVTPYITNQFGSEAYGFVKLANDFTNYATLFSVALNSMASRFLMLERTRGNNTAANQYFSSITLANVILSTILMVPSVICVVFLDKFLSVPAVLVTEVKLTFAITFASFICNLLFSTYSNCYYLTNMLSVGSVRDALMNILRVVSIILLFALAVPRISYVAFGSLIATVFAVGYNYYQTRKLTPELRFRFCDFDWKKLKEVLATGIWNSITKLSQIFSSGLDLLMTNIMINPQMMGYLSLAKTVPTLVASFNATVANVFSPNLMMLYAQDDMEELKKATKTAMRFMCLFVTIPNAILVTMGKEFFDLWVPGQPSQLINILSVLTIINSCVTGPAQPLYQIFTITNKVKESSIVLIIYGFTSVLVTYICLQLTGLGVYAVAGVSLVGSLIVATMYHIPFAAKYIGLPKSTFFPEIGVSLLSMVILCIVGFVVNSALELNTSWIMWFVGAVITGIIGLVINAFLILNKEERTTLFNKFFSRFIKRRG